MDYLGIDPGCNYKFCDITVYDDFFQFRCSFFYPQNLFEIEGVIRYFGGVIRWITWGSAPAAIRSFVVEEHGNLQTCTTTIII